MHLKSLGDQAVLAYCRDEAAAGQLAERVRQAAFPWVVDVVQAYTSVAVFYDLASIDFFAAREMIARLEHAEAPTASAPARIVAIPCCYELGLDWERLEKYSGLIRAEIIELHSAATYTVFAIGFCPGFPYLGYLPEKIAGVPRLATPRLRVDAGSVGLTGRQTGIYTEERPGGWNIVGRTPLELVHVRDGYFPLRTGDRVKFQRIDEREFEKLKGKRL